MNGIVVVVDLIIFACGIGIGFLVYSLCSMAGESGKCKECRVDKLIREIKNYSKVRPTVIFEEKDGKEKTPTGQSNYPTM